MTQYNTYWIPFKRGHAVLKNLGYGSKQQLPVLIPKGQSGELSFTMDNIVLGMLVALTQQQEAVSYDKKRAVKALRFFCARNGDPTCERMLSFAHGNIDPAVVAFVRAIWLPRRRIERP